MLEKDVLLGSDEGVYDDACEGLEVEVAVVGGGRERGWVDRFAVFVVHFYGGESRG